MIGRRVERGSGISVLAARHDDDDDIAMYIETPYITMYILFSVILSLIHQCLITEQYAHILSVDARLLILFSTYKMYMMHISNVSLYVKKLISLFFLFI